MRLHLDTFAGDRDEALVVELTLKSGATFVGRIDETSLMGTELTMQRLSDKAWVRIVIEEVAAVAWKS